MTFPSHVVPDITQFEIVPIEESEDNQLEKIRGYYVTSTAPINVEDNPVLPKTSVKAQINKIAQYLIESNAPEIIASIHGYSTKRKDAEERHRKIYNYANSICEPNNYVFLGYRWPSENPLKDDAEPDMGLRSISFQEKLKYAFQSLPTLLTGILISGLVFAIFAIAILVIGQNHIFAILLLS